MRPPIKTDLLRIARVFDKASEIPGPEHSPLVLAMLQAAAKWVKDDETAWCGAFMNAVVLIARSGDPKLPTPSAPLRARRWLEVGAKVEVGRARAGFDVVVTRRNGGPGPEVLDAIGHVGLYVRHDSEHVWIYGGNQANQVCEMRFPVRDVLGIRRL